MTQIDYGYYLSRNILEQFCNLNFLPLLVRPLGHLMNQFNFWWAPQNWHESDEIKLHGMAHTKRSFLLWFRWITDIRSDKAFSNNLNLKHLRFLHLLVRPLGLLVNQFNFWWSWNGSCQKVYGVLTQNDYGYYLSRNILEQFWNLNIKCLRFLHLLVRSLCLFLNQFNY